MPKNKKEDIKMSQVIRDHLKKLELDKDVSIILCDCNMIFNSNLDPFGGRPILKYFFETAI